MQRSNRSPSINHVRKTVRRIGSRAVDWPETVLAEPITKFKSHSWSCNIPAKHIAISSPVVRFYDQGVMQSVLLSLSVRMGTCDTLLGRYMEGGLFSEGLCFISISLSQESYQEAGKHA